MEKSKILEEFIELKRLLKEHENKQASLNKIKLHENKFCSNSCQEGNKSKVFFNPKKISELHNGTTTKVSENISNHKLTAKVFINPNFNKPGSSQTIKIPSEQHSSQPKEQLQIRDRGKKYNLNSSTSVKQLFKKQSSPSSLSQELISSKYVHKISGIPVVEGKNSLNSNSRVIFVNPQFSSLSKINTRVINTAYSKNIERKTSNGPKCCDEKLSPILKMSEPKTAINMCLKRKTVINRNEIGLSDSKRRKKIDYDCTGVKKIFVNPKFEKNESNPKNLEKGKIAGTTCHSKENPNISTSSKSIVQSVGSSNISTIPVLVGRKEMNKFTSVSYPLCTVVGSVSGKQNVKKVTGQRTRTCNSSLVIANRTKWVRKRKLSQRVVDTNGEQCLPKPLFVSKTKLVRNVPKKNNNSTCSLKIKVKQISQKTHSKISLAEKLNRSRKKSVTDSTSNLTSLTPRSAVVRKVKSNNGKSLKLIRDIPSSSTLEMKMKTQNMVNTRKTELRQQASRITMCLVQARLKRNQFSKINVPVKVSQSTSYHKNVYKKNNLVSRKSLTKAALLGKKEATVGKNNVRSTQLDMTKFIKSKYRLIRKQSLNTASRYRLGQKIMNKITLNNKLVQRKKLKWKSKIIAPKQTLTRKDLSIKKIGGVFYRYSRTTLAKNKPSLKQVSQLQKKGIHHLASEYRQNRFCLYKNVAKRRVSCAGGVLAPAAAGMSWRRSTVCSARSILTQAKQKSIHLLSKKMKKNNEPCLFFHRHGRCSGQERGTCVRLHDKKYVAVCKKFVQGSCSDDKCSLSHSPSSHNMPTCHHFLAGHCGRDHCPYPHIKVNDSAPICLDFLKGFCHLGEQCTKRHFEICPSFEKGICARGKYCPYPHPKNRMGEKLKGKFKHIKRKPQPPKEADSVSIPSLRYFEDANLQKENQIQLKTDEERKEAEEEESTCWRKRPQLGELPSFIPLSWEDT